MRLLLTTLALLLLAGPAFAKEKKDAQVHDPAPLRYGMDLEEANRVVSDPAMWRVAYRVDTDTTTEFAAAWSGSVFYKVRFLDGKCCYIEKRAEVEAEEVDQLLQMYRAVHGDSREATSNRDGTLIFSRWQLPQREITISAVGRHGKYKLFYEEFDPVQVGDVRVAQERELGERTETDPLTGQQRVSLMGQSASTEQPESEASDSEQAEAEAKPSADDKAAEDAEPAEDQAKPRPKRKKDDPVTGDRG
jgi:hypothetical protein